MAAVIKTLCLIDDIDYIFGLKKWIEKNNYSDNIIQFSNGFDGIEFLKKVQASNTALPDIILLDINMPVMDGWQFMELFALLKPSLNKKIEVYMVSSSINNVDIDRAKAINDVSDFIVKPIDARSLGNIFKQAA